jgi:nucleoside triphosphatase
VLSGAIIDMVEGTILHRTIVVGLVWNRQGDLLFCRMSPDRGVFPGQWGFPGGGIEPGETMESALRRELREELGIEVEDIRPAFFKDCLHRKIFADETVQPVYMIFLLFHCAALQDELRLNDEFVEYRWVGEEEVGQLDLNEETVDTLDRLGSWTSLR